MGESLTQDSSNLCVPTASQSMSCTTVCLLSPHASDQHKNSSTSVGYAAAMFFAPFPSRDYRNLLNTPFV